jgi:altronate dehydratase small subunit
MSSAFQIDERDNVATLLADAGPGPVEVKGAAPATAVLLHETVALGHKIALRPIAEGEAVIKFGVAIGTAARPVAEGEWVHLHNCRSRYDERSGDFDPVTGEARDTRYE